MSNTDEIYVKSVVASGLEGHGKTKQELDSYMDGASGFSELTGEADATISLEDAKSKAQELIDELGLTDLHAAMQICIMKSLSSEIRQPPRDIVRFTLFSISDSLMVCL